MVRLCLILVAFQGLSSLAVKDITVGGDRPVFVRVPPGHDPEVPAPLLVELHGGTGPNSLLRFRAPARNAGFLYVRPVSRCRIGSLANAWNPALTNCEEWSLCPDESAYIREVIDSVMLQFAVDPERIYVIGRSGGAAMALRMACDHADVLAAVAIWEAPWTIEPQRERCLPINPVHMLIMAGDPARIQYTGGQPDFDALCSEPFFLVGVEEQARQWGGLNGCSINTVAAPRLDNSYLPGRETLVTRFTECAPDGQLELWTILGEDHGPDYTSEFHQNVIDWFLLHPKGRPSAAWFTMTPPMGVSPLTVTVDASGSMAAEGTAITRYEWDFGGEATALGTTANHTFRQAGSYPIGLTITTDNGLEDTIQQVVDVWPQELTVVPIQATASGSYTPGTVPEKTIDGSGLTGDLHGTTLADMWLSDGVPAWIHYAFDRPYRLHEMWIWNANEAIESFLGFGAKDVVIEHSLDGETWIILEAVAPLAQGPGANGYAPNNVIDFQGTLARHVRLTINSVHGVARQTGLSEVRFFYIPTTAMRPKPTSGAMEVAPDVTLTWSRSGQEANRHEIYLGSDPNHLALAGTVQESSFDTLGADLQLDQSYFWRIDEVNEAMEPSTWQGDLWRFQTVDTLVIDDMERYQHAEWMEIWSHWIDGVGDPANGSTVGADPVIGDLSPETRVVHGGKQSLPFHFDNNSAPHSEVTRVFDPAQDWTRHGIQTLVLHFSGSGDNTGGGQLYVKINDTKVVHPEADALPPGWDLWTPWNIDLPSLGADLTQVQTLTIGVEGSGAQGIVYVDDIRLYREAPRSQRVLTWFEAESGTLTAPLEFLTDDPSASSGQCIGTTEGVGHSDAEPPSDGVATYSFTVPEEGVYRLALRVIARPGHDSFWVRIPGMVTNMAIHNSGWIRFNDIQVGDTWHWDEVHSNSDWDRVVDFTLTAGTHTLEVAHREAGTLLDAIAVIRSRK